MDLKPKDAHNNKALFAEEEIAWQNGFRLIAGIDEAGRGPLAGPVVAAAVILKDLNFGVRIDDSKKLTPAGRDKAFLQILDKAIIGIGIVFEDIIDKINIYRATLLAMERAVLNLSSHPDLLLIDGKMKLRIRCSQRSIVAGDSKSISIASASIVAKVTRDKLLSFYNSIFPEYGFKRHKGYGTRGHIDVLKSKGYSPIHRRTFNVRG
ncbi:ribonuclease HII [Candidatus Omnitrophota bacterium]